MSDLVPSYLIGGPNDGNKVMLETGRPYVVVVSVRDGHTEEHVYKIVAHVKGYGVDQAFVACYEGPK